MRWLDASLTVIPTKAGIQLPWLLLKPNKKSWTPAFAGVTPVDHVGRE